MKASGRLRFLIGIMIVVLIVGLLTLYLTNTMSMSHSTKASIGADTVSIGTDYAGLVTKQNVEVGDKVTKGEVLFEIQSTQLNKDLTSGTVTVGSLPFKVNPIDNYAQLTASEPGVVQSIFYRSGSYAPSGSVVADIDTVDSLYVVAHFHLSPPDYARIDKSSALDLAFPDNSTKQGTIYSINLVANGTGVDTVVKARIRNADITDLQFTVGTPVSATLHLRQAAWYEDVTNFVTKLFRPLGKS